MLAILDQIVVKNSPGSNSHLTMGLTYFRRSFSTLPQLILVESVKSVL